MHTRTFSALAMAGFSLVTTGVANAQAKWDMPMAYPSANYQSENGVAFANCVNAGAGKEVNIVVHASGSLIAGNDIKRSVQTGQVPIGERLISAHAKENPIFGLDSIPFLATSFAESDKLWNIARPKIDAALDTQNLVYLYSVPWPPQGLYFKKEVNKIADMKGIKFRSYNAATAKIASMSGMIPVQIEAAELSRSLATGVVESMISSGSTGVDSKAWESLTHFYDTKAWLPRNIVFANKDAFKKLSPATKNVIQTCAAKAAIDGAKMAESLTAGYLKTLAQNGMKVADPSTTLKADLGKIGTVMSAEWIETAGPDGKAIIDAFKK